MTPFKTHDLLRSPIAAHGFFGRKGGVSKAQYDSLNTGRGSDDRPDNITENRRRVAASLGTAEPSLLSCHQCHSADVMIVDGPWAAGFAPKADAIVTKTPGIAVSALAADCAPVLFIDEDARVIGAAHAGWRGAVAGITDQTVKAMESLGADRANIRAVVGPCISQNHYEVGPEFKAQFIAQNPKHARFFIPGKGDRVHFDLKAYVTNRLISFGVGQADALPDCTYDAPKDYFSYRYNNHNGLGDYGRNISAIMLSE